MTYHTGVTLFNYEVTVSERGGLGVQRVTLKLPSETHHTFNEALTDALLNMGISLAQRYTISKLRKL